MCVFKTNAESMPARLFCRFWARPRGIPRAKSEIGEIADAKRVFELLMYVVRLKITACILILFYLQIPSIYDETRA